MRIQDHRCDPLSIALGTLLCVLLVTCGSAPCDPSSFDTSANFASQRFYQIRRLNGHWSFVDPDGQEVFVRAVSQVDTNDFGGQGNFQSYDAVYLRGSSGWSRNLAEAAKDSLKADVVNAQNITVHVVGDEIYLGSQRFKPIATYFWLDRLGSGGVMNWYYSTADGRWRAVNGNGNPFAGKESSAALDPEGRYSLDVGGYFQPDDHGFSERRGPNADRIAWWSTSKGPPADFTRTSLGNDRTPRYYIKGVVTRGFVISPVLNQTYERHQLIEQIKAKYDPDGSGNPFYTWAESINSRLRAWGFNATGQYSYRYWQVAPKLRESLAIEPTWQLSGHSMRPDYPYHVKNVYAGAVCPPGGHDFVYQGHQPDVFDPVFSKSLKDEAAKHLSEPMGAPEFALIPEEADDLFGLNKTTHDHLGYIVLAQNPYVASDEQLHLQYTDHRLYSKYALRDFLKTRYTSIDKLNYAWNTHYTTWATSSGDLDSGTNAWGSGSGLMDENGQHIYYPEGASCRAGSTIQYNAEFTNPMFPAVRKDLDDFVEYFAQTYGKTLNEALQQLPHPPVFLPLYFGPVMAYRGLAPYVDGFWVNGDDPKRLKQIYEASRRPIILADYSTANPDSPLFFGDSKSSLSYGQESDLTTISGPTIEYIFRAPWQVTFPDIDAIAAVCITAKGLTPHPQVAAVRWNSFDLHGNYKRCIGSDSRVELFNWVADKPAGSRSQKDRADRMINQLQNAVGLRADDDTSFVVGFEHWSFYDNSPSDYGEIGNFGLATLEDNAYDGIEARRVTGKDSRGYDRGGEERDYGDLLGPLSRYLKTLDQPR